LDLLELAYTDVVSEQQLVALIRSLRFETVLQYVRIPGFRDTPNKIVSASKYPKRSWRLGTEGGGFWFVFQLLREKGVRKIIKVIIDDEEDFHRDEIIEQLVLFDIEEWDWIKLDLCSEIIRRAAPNVRKVSLYSSGQNAVLRGWSGNDGLNSMTQVRNGFVLRI